MYVEFSQLHYSLVLLFPIPGTGVPIPVIIGREAKYTLDRSAEHQRSQTRSQNHTEAAMQLEEMRGTGNVCEPNLNTSP